MKTYKQPQSKIRNMLTTQIKKYYQKFNIIPTEGNSLLLVQNYFIKIFLDIISQCFLLLMILDLLHIR
jgi:hypothetical protein